MSTLSIQIICSPSPSRCSIRNSLKRPPCPFVGASFPKLRSWRVVAETDQGGRSSRCQLADTGASHFSALFHFFLLPRTSPSSILVNIQVTSPTSPPSKSITQGTSENETIPAALHQSSQLPSMMASPLAASSRRKVRYLGSMSEREREIKEGSIFGVSRIP